MLEQVFFGDTGLSSHPLILWGHGLLLKQQFIRTTPIPSPGSESSLEVELRALGTCKSTLERGELEQGWGWDEELGLCPLNSLSVFGNESCVLIWPWALQYPGFLIQSWFLFLCVDPPWKLDICNHYRVIVKLFTTFSFPGFVVQCWCLSLREVLRGEMLLWVTGNVGGDLAAIQVTGNFSCVFLLLGLAEIWNRW